MKKINLGFFALALALCVSVAANAATVSIGGAGEKDPSAGTTGTLQILFDTAPQNFTLLNGGTFFGF